MSAEKPGAWPLTHEEVRRWLEEQEWKVAVTAPDNPHAYCLRPNTDAVMFWRIVLHIREHGYQYRWGRGEYTQLRAGDYDYWTMGAPLERTLLINRKHRDQTAKDEAEGKAGCGPVDPEDARRKRGG